MKEAYFSAETLEETILDFRSELSKFIKPGKLHFQEKNSALLVLDMQRYFLEPASHAYIPSAAGILPRIGKLIENFHARRLPIFFTQHTNTPRNAGMMARWWRDLIHPKDKLAELTPELNSAGSYLLRKHQYDAFYRTSLEKELRKLGVRQVVICGVMTHLCCETSARSAFMRGFEVFFPIDGTATYHREFHLSSLRNLTHGFACLPTIPELLESMEKSHAG